MKYRPFEQYRGLRRELYILTIGRMMTNMGSMVFPVLTLILNQKLGLNASTIAIVMTIYSIVSIPMSLLGGIAADKFNKKRIIVFCDLISISAFLYCFFMPITIPNIIIFGAATLFQTIEWPSYDALIADFTTSKDRERAYSLSYLGANLGLVLSPTLAGLLFNNYLNLSFLISGLAILSSTILIILLIKNISKEKDTSQAAEYEQDLAKGQKTFTFIFKHRVILLYIFLMLLGNFIYSMYNYLMPLDLSAQYGENGSVIFGTMSSVNCIVVVLFTSLITRFFRRISDSDKFYFGTGLELVGYLIFFFLIGFTPFCYVAIVLFTYGEIFNTLASSPFLTRRIPASHRGRVLAISNVIVMLAASFLQIGVGALYDSPNFGRYFAWGLIAIAGILALTIITIIRILDRKDYPALYYRHKLDDGRVLAIKTANLKDLNVYYQDFQRDEALFIEPNEMEEYHYSKDTVHEYWNKIHADKHRENFLVFLDKEPIGEISLKNIVFNNECELSIHMKNDNYKNKGYGFIVEKMIVDYAFNRLNLRKVKADSIVTNTRSQHVLEKVGFKQVDSNDKFIYYELYRNA